MKPLVPAKAGTQGYNSVYVALLGWTAPDGISVPG
jgi:hypothetical protein